MWVKSLAITVLDRKCEPFIALMVNLQLGNVSFGPMTLAVGSVTVDWHEPCSVMTFFTSL